MFLGRWRLFTAVLFAASSTVAVGQIDVSPQHVEAWLKRELQAAAAIPAWPGFSIRWRSEDPLTLSPKDIDALRSEVAGKPEHPRRHELEAAERMLRTGAPYVMRFELFSTPEGAWRFNSTYVDAKTFTDVTLTNGTAWKLSPMAIELFGDAPSADRRRSLAGERYVFVPMLASLLYGSLDRAAFSKLEIGDLRIDGSRWSATASRRSGTPLVLGYEGRWDPQAGRGFVERYTIVRNPSAPTFEGTGERFEEWEFHPEPGVWAAKRAVLTKPGGEVWRVHVFEGFAPLPAGGHDAVFAAPSPGGADVVRGPIPTNVEVGDHARAVVTRMNEQGQLTEAPLPGARESARWGWNTVGLSLLALLSFGVFCAVIARLRSRRQA